jgi:N-acetylmuramoyl-L-alanine amidase
MRWSKHLGALAATALLCCVSDSARSQAAQTPSPAKASASPAATTNRGLSPSSKAIPEISARKQEYFVMIDPGHGGSDKGSVLGSGVTEKQVTLAFARELRKELAERGIACRLIRDSDVPVSLDKRAEIANEQRPFLYVSIHAAAGPSSIRVYSPYLSKPSSPPGLFVNWNSAQFPVLERSTAVARSVSRELQRKNIRVVGLSAALRPLIHITAPAIAIELAVPSHSAATLLTEKFDNPIATAVAIAINQGHATGGQP